MKYGQDKPLRPAERCAMEEPACMEEELPSPTTDDTAIANQMDAYTRVLGPTMAHEEDIEDIDEDNDEPSSSSADDDDDDDGYDDGGDGGGGVLAPSVADQVTAHLAASGPVGLAAAAAVATGRRRRRLHAFESNPFVRKRQQTRLLRKLRGMIDEYTTRVGQQAVVLFVSPRKPNPVFKAFGAAPLDNVVRRYKSSILEDVEEALSVHAPAVHGGQRQPELPPLLIDGIPVSVDKMTQAQLRAFIPEMLKFSTGRGKPGWGKEACRPPWWPPHVPWANVRSDARSHQQKQLVSWTHALRAIVKNCYRQHGREDLLYAFDDAPVPQVAAAGGRAGDDVAGDNGATIAEQEEQEEATTLTSTLLGTDDDGSGATMVQAINPDGSLSLVQVMMDRGWTEVETLSDMVYQAGVHDTATVTVAINSEGTVTAVTTLPGGNQILFSGEAAAAVGALAQQEGSYHVRLATDHPAQVSVAATHGLACAEDVEVVTLG
ncbi:nuclear respiratory factor 1-like isoform X1 [Lampetra fluviatilis]